MLRGLRERFLAWWRRPLTAGDSRNGAICAAAAGFWIGGLGAISLAAQPVPWTAPAIGALAGIVLGIVCGRRWPKLSMMLFFPFLTFGFSLGN